MYCKFSKNISLLCYVYFCSFSWINTLELPVWLLATLLEKFWQISLHVTDDVIAKLNVT